MPAIDDGMVYGVEPLEELAPTTPVLDAVAEVEVTPNAKAMVGLDMTPEVAEGAAEPRAAGMPNAPTDYSDCLELLSCQVA
eukprot:9768366-Alexandrium_andersonii.AAC.1